MYPNFMEDLLIIISFSFINFFMNLKTLSIILFIVIQTLKTKFTIATD